MNLFAFPDKKALLDPARTSMANKSEESVEEASEKSEPEPESSMPHSLSVEKSESEADSAAVPAIEQKASNNEEHEEKIVPDVHPSPKDKTNSAPLEGTKANASESFEDEVDSQSVPVALFESKIEQSEPKIEQSESKDEHVERLDSSNSLQLNESSETAYSEDSGSIGARPSIHMDEDENIIPKPHELHNDIQQAELADEHKTQDEETVDEISPVQADDAPIDSQTVSVLEAPGSTSPTSDKTGGAEENSGSPVSVELSSSEVSEVVPEMLSHGSDAVSGSLEVSRHGSDQDSNLKEYPSLESNMSNSPDYMIELEKVKKEMKMMETALQGAARQAQVYKYGIQLGHYFLGSSPSCLVHH